jgi:pSer/pThr/pTyr-binding forkhead associated (FHA) protein
MPKFLLQFQGAVLREIPAKDEITIGRKPDNDIVIDNPAVSAYHCKITPVGPAFFVEDLNSTNGVYVNAKKIERAALQNNDVIGIAKHAIQFIDERPQQTGGTMPVPPPTTTADGTMMISPKKQQDLAKSAANLAQRRSIIRVLKGVVDQVEHELKGRSTYIGKSDNVQIKIKGSGLFGAAPENAAMIAHNRDGYFLLPVKEGYVKLNGNPVRRKEQLQNGDIIQAGGTTLKFEEQMADE